MLPSVAVVVTSYNLPAFYLRRFLEFNCYTLRQHDIDLYIVSNLHPISNFYVPIEAPVMDIFSITNCSNLGIKKAIKYGANRIIKTDIDCILDHDFLNHAKLITAAYRYWECDVEKTNSGFNIESRRMNSRTMGTISGTAEEWQKSGYYCEEMCGYGIDDYSIMQRFKKAKTKIALLSRPKCWHIYHQEKHNRDTINPVRRTENFKLHKEGSKN